MNFDRNINEIPDILAGGDATSKNHFSLKPDQEELECHVLENKDVTPAHSRGSQFSCTEDLQIHNESDALLFQPSSVNPIPVLSRYLNGNSSSNEHNNGDIYDSYEEKKDEQQAAIQQHVSINETQCCPEDQEGKTIKYKFDDHYLAFVQNFTSYCEDRTNLIFDGCIFFDDDFFPRSTQLTEYVPINIIAPFVESLQMQIPSSSEYCKFAPCGSTLYDYFEDYKAFRNRENILRSQVVFILNSLQCPQLTSLEIDSTPVTDVSTDRYPVDRLSTWNDNLSSFISRHVKTLKNIQIKVVRYKGLGTPSSFSNTDMHCISKNSFPKLNELEVTLWDNRISTSKDSDSESPLSDKESDKNVWVPKWFPDIVDQYWISLMKSQLHGSLTKLCWIAAANLCWDEVFQPIIYFNRNSLECLHIIEIDGILSSMKTKKNNTNGDGDCSSFSTSSMVLSCAAFSKLCKLKELSLRKPNCYLTDLTKLPESIEEFTVEDISIKSSEIATLASLPNLKILQLANCSPTTHPQFQTNPDKFGVDKDVLLKLLHSRRLQELCIWRHCLGLNMDELLNKTGFIMTSVLEKINSYLTNICKSSQKISPTQFCEWNSKQLREDKMLLESLEKLGIIDEECIVIHNQK